MLIGRKSIKTLAKQLAHGWKNNGLRRNQRTFLALEIEELIEAILERERAKK